MPTTSGMRADGRTPAGRDDHGFSLIELMVVVLIIAILLAVAIPSYFGARKRANDRAAQSNLRNANTNALVFYTDHQTFTNDPAQMTALDPSLGYTSALAGVDVNRVYLTTDTTFSADDTLYLAARSKNGACFWIRTVGDKNLPRFAQNDCAAIPAVATFGDAW